MTSKRWPGLIALTGTPGTGKKTVAPLLVRPTGTRSLDLKSVATPGSQTDQGEEIQVDTRRLRSQLLKLDLSDTVLFGHMIPDVLRRGEPSFVTVLRCEPTELKRRLVRRGYGPQKVLENIEAELIGVVLSHCLSVFGDSVVHEYDTTTSDAVTIAKRISRDYRNGSEHGRPWRDWTTRYDSSTKLMSLLSGPTTDPASTWTSRGC